MHKFDSTIHKKKKKKGNELTPRTHECHMSNFLETFFKFLCLLGAKKSFNRSLKKNTYFVHFKYDSFEKLQILDFEWLWEHLSSIFLKFIFEKALTSLAGDCKGFYISFNIVEEWT